MGRLTYSVVGILRLGHNLCSVLPRHACPTYTTTIQHRLVLCGTSPQNRWLSFGFLWPRTIQAGGSKWTFGANAVRLSLGLSNSWLWGKPGNQLERIGPRCTLCYAGEIQRNTIWRSPPAAVRKTPLEPDRMMTSLVVTPKSLGCSGLVLVSIKTPVKPAERGKRWLRRNRTLRRGAQTSVITGQRRRLLSSARPVVMPCTPR